MQGATADCLAIPVGLERAKLHIRNSNEIKANRCIYVISMEKIMFEDFSYEGEWWLPDNPDDRIHGSLKYDHDKDITLYLSKIFKCEKPDLFKPDIILGLTNDGEKVTLIESIEINTTNIYSATLEEEVGTSTFISRYLLIGKHVKSKDKNQFYSLYISSTYLEHWLNPKSPFRTERTEKGFLVSIQRDINYETRIESIQATLSITSSISTKGDKWTNFQLNNTAYFGIIPDGLKDLSWYLDVLFDLDILMTLLIGVPIYPKILTGKGEETHRFKDTSIRESVEIYYVLFIVFCNI